MPWSFERSIPVTGFARGRAEGAAPMEELITTKRASVLHPARTAVAGDAKVGLNFGRIAV